MPAAPNRSRVSRGSLVYAPQNPPPDMQSPTSARHPVGAISQEKFNYTFKTVF